MNFSELCDEVVLITKRPDLRNLIESSVRAATLKVHQKDFFYRDIVEVPVQFPDADNESSLVTSFKPTDLVPRYRKPAYLNEWLYDGTSNTLGRRGRKFTLITPLSEQDAYGFLKQDVYYLAGDVLQIRSSRKLTHVLFGAYVYPDITPDGFKSWIADEFPWAIIHASARVVFRSIGAVEQSQMQDELAAEQYALLTINSIPDEGN